MREALNLATVANVVRPAGQKAYVPTILADCVPGPTVRGELNEKFVEGLCDVHGQLLGIVSWILLSHAQ